MGYSSFPAYVSIDELRYKNIAKRKTYLKKHPQASPIVLEGKLGKTWWGSAWNKNLERYADFDNRLSRGKRYVKAESIFDLIIEKGCIEADVSGSGRKIYHVIIRIEEISAVEWEKIIVLCGNKIDSMEELLLGKFPKALKDAFFDVQQGFFPTAKQIRMDCSCPDFAIMCKHVSAVLYGVSVRLDEDPALFFKLRGISTEDLLKQAVDENIEQLVTKAKKKSKRVLEEEDITSLFHLE